MALLPDKCQLKQHLPIKPYHCADHSDRPNQHLMAIEGLHQTNTESTLNIDQMLTTRIMNTEYCFVTDIDCDYHRISMIIRCQTLNMYHRLGTCYQLLFID